MKLLCFGEKRGELIERCFVIRYYYNNYMFYLRVFLIRFDDSFVISEMCVEEIFLFFVWFDDYDVDNSYRSKLVEGGN